MRRSALILLLLVVLGGLGWLAWHWLGDPPATRVRGRESASAASSARTPDTDPAAPAPSTTAERVESAPAPIPSAPPAPVAVPESYRRALSGLRGRVVEQDGAPVANLEVELLELLGSGMLGDFERVFGLEPLPVPDLSIARARTGPDGVFELHGALGAALHAIGVDLGGARGTLRLVDRTLAAGTVTDLGDIVLTPFVTWKGRVVGPDREPIAGARVRASLFPPLVFQPGVIDLARIVAMIEVRSWSDLPIAVADIPASVRAWDAKLPFPTTVSGEDGSFELAGVPQGLATLIVDREGFTGGFKGPMPTGKRDRDVGAIELSRGRSVRGGVVDPDGRPIAGVEVIAGVVIEPARIAIAMPAAAPTDADGRFLVEHLADQGADVRVAARRHRGDAWTTQSTDGSEPVTLVLPGGVDVEVTMLDEGGRPVEQAELSVRSTGGPPFLTWQPPAPIERSRITALAPGKWRIGGMTPGDYELLGRASGYGLAHVELSVRTAPLATELRFRQARELEVVVLDLATRAPIEHAEVTVGSAGGRMRPPLLTRRTDVAGRAHLSGLPAEDLRVRAFHPAHAPLVRQVAAAEVSSAQAPTELLLGPGAQLAGRVHQGGRPLAEPMVFLLHPRDGGQSIDDELPRFAVPGADGRFELRGLKPGSARWEVLPRLFAGDPQEAVQAIASAGEAFRTARRGTLELVEGETTELDVDLDPALANRPARVTGVVRAAGGGEFRIRLHMSGEGVPPGEQVRLADVVANAPFTFESVHPGFVSLTVERRVEPPQGVDPRWFHGPSLHQEWFELEAGAERAIDVELELVTGDALVLDDGGNPVRGANVQFSLAMPANADGVVNVQMLHGVSDERGVVRAELPRPGRYDLSCVHPELGRAVASADLPASEPVTLRLERGVPCSGRVTFTPDLPSDVTAWISVMPASHPWGQHVASAQLAPGQRNFTFVGVTPGRYRARVFADGRRHGEADFEIGPNGDDHLELKFVLQ